MGTGVCNRPDFYHNKKEGWAHSRAQEHRRNKDGYVPNVSPKNADRARQPEVVYTPKELDQINVEIAEVNRPGLFLAGYYDYFDKLRLQIMGLAEMNFLSGLSAEKRYEALEQLFRQQPPAVIVGRSEELEPFPEMLELAEAIKRAGAAAPNETTCTLMGSLISVLNLELVSHHPARRAGGVYGRGHPDL